MNLLSAVFRYIHRAIQSAGSFLRILKLKLLYPGLSVNFSSVIETNCAIKCIKGGRLVIRNSVISSGTQIVADAGSKISILHSFIGRNCVITAKSGVSIDKNCLIAEMVVIRDQDHLVDNTSNLDSRNQFVTFPITIHQHVWIAAKATVLKGVTIGENAVVAASAVIMNDVGAGEVWGGIPGKFLKKITGSPAQ